MKRWFVVLVLVVLIGLTACSGNGNDNKAAEPPNEEKVEATNGENANNSAQEGQSEVKYPLVQEKIALKMMGAKNPTQVEWDKMDFFDYMENLTNIHFDFNTPISSAYGEKKNIIFATNDLPDVFFGGMLTPSDEVNYGTQGALIPLEDLIDKYAPNIRKMFETYPEARKSVTTMDGHIYALPKYNEVAIRNFYKLFVNPVWLDNLGIDKLPQTTDELYELLKRFKEEDPNRNGQADEIPLSLFSDSHFDEIIGHLLPMFGVAMDPQYMIGVKGDKALLMATQPEYKKFLEYLRKLYKEKLLDPEVFIHTKEQFDGKGKNGQLGVLTVSGVPWNTLNTAENESVPLLPPISDDPGRTPVVLLRPLIERGTFAITNVNKYPAETIQWVDHLYSYDGGRYAAMGKEGFAWEWTDDSKSEWIQLARNGMSSVQTKAASTPDGSGLPSWRMSDYMFKEQSDYWQEQNQLGKEVYGPLGIVALPQLYFTNDEQRAIDAVRVDLASYVIQMTAKFIIDSEPMENWDAYVATLQKMGSNQYEQTFQNAYDRYNAAGK